MYQNITRVFPLTEAWYMAYRNYEDDPAFGTSKCVRFSQVGPEEEGRYPTMVEYGDGTQSANALMTLGSSEGYTAKNKLNYFPEGQEESLTLYLAYMDVGKCSVFRNVYVKEDACCVSVPKSLLGQSTIYCDFAYDLLSPVWASPFSQVIVTTTLATEGFPVFLDKSDVRFGVLAYWPQYAFTRHKEATPSTSTLINEASKPWNVASSVSGHGNSLRMQSSNPFCFIVQILLCLCSAPVWASPFSQVIVTTTLATEGFPVFLDKSDVRFGVLAYWPQYAFTRHKEATLSTSTLINEASKPWNVASSVSGHGNSLRMQSSNPFCFIVQEEQLVSLGDSKNLQKVVREVVGRLFSKQVQEQFSGPSGLPRKVKVQGRHDVCHTKLHSCSVDAVQKWLTGREAGKGNRVKKTDTPLVVPTAFDDEGHSG
ncbi:uncharacterized protein ISCGN_011070 [Ixodes scapularis]